MKNFLLLLAIIAVGIIVYFLYFSKPAPPPAPKKIAVSPPVIVDMKETLRKYSSRADAGDALAKAICRFACYDLGNFNEGDKYLQDANGDCSVDQGILKEAFNSEHRFFRFIQGYCFYNGLGVGQDFIKAFAKFSGTQELPYSQVAMAFCILRGNGAEASPIQAASVLESLLPQTIQKAVEGRRGGGYCAEVDGFFKTVLNQTQTCKYPPAAIALGDIRQESFDGLPKDNVKSLKCYMMAYAANLNAADARLQKLFASVSSDAKELADAKAMEYADSGELSAAVNAFLEKNKSLKSMPEILAKETERFKNEQIQAKRRQLFMDACSFSGWLVFDDLKQGIPKDAYFLDRDVYADMASDYLCRFYKMNKVFPEGIHENAELILAKLKLLSGIAKANGFQEDSIGLNAFRNIFEAKLAEDKKPVGTQEARTLEDLLSRINDARPTPISLVSEHYLILHENDMLTDNLEKAVQQLKDIDSRFPVRSFSYRRNDDDLMKNSSEKHKDEVAYLAKYKDNPKKNDPFYIDSVKGRNGNGKTFDEISSKIGYVVIVNGEGPKNVSTQEWQSMKTDYESYLAEKARLNGVIAQGKTKQVANEARRRRNADILRKMFIETSQISADAKILQKGSFMTGQKDKQ